MSYFILSYQVYKEAGRKQAARRKKDILSEVNILHDDVSRITQDIEEFVNRRDLLNTARDLETKDSETDENNMNPNPSNRPEVVAKLSKKVKGMSKMMDAILDDQDILLKERKKCFEILGYGDSAVTSEDSGDEETIPFSKQSLNNLLQESLSRVSNELGQSKSEVTSGKQMTSTLESQVKDLRKEFGKQLSHKSLQIENQQRNIKENADTIKQLQRMLETSNHDRDVTHAKVTTALFTF